MTPDPSSNIDSNREKHLFGWFLFPLSLFPLVALITYDWRAIGALHTPALPSSNWIGALGDGFAYIGYQIFGLGIWLLPFICIVIASALVAGKRIGSIRRILWATTFLVAMSALIQIIQSHAPGVHALIDRVNIANAGGVVGYLLITAFLSPLLSDFGASVLMIILAMIALVATVGLKNLIAGFVAIWKWTMQRGAPAAPTAEAGTDEYEAQQAAYLAAIQAKEDAKRQAEEEKARAKAEKEAEKERIRAAKEAAKAAKAAEKAAEATPSAPRAPKPSTPADGNTVEDKGPYVLPGLDLLAPRKVSVADHSDVNSMSERIVNTLKLFGVDATMSFTVQGPVVTKYAIKLAPGTAYSKVTGHSDELMGALHAKSLRMEAPIPGKEEVGIEVPNAKPAGISFREIFESDAWKEANAKMELPLLFGKDASGKELIADLASMPHMLVAGATGQGKSVCLNSILCGLLMTRVPEQLKLIMVDPKSVEFAAYSRIPHLLIPVIADNNKVVKALMWAVVEMEKRLKLFTRAHVRNIYDFNHRKSFTQTDMFGEDSEVASSMPKTLPYIVIIIDEVADLMMQCSKVVTPPISRIAAKARAAGIHLILATQRPDAKIITGSIKANIPGRVAFKTASSIDSRTILDDAGAENLIGRGDMLFKGKDGLLTRAQGAWISDPEIANVTTFIEQHANTQFDEKFAKNLARVQEAGVEDPFADMNEEDAKAAKAEAREQVKAAENASDFKKAVECIINTKRASTSHFQRQMGWGYNHAAKILDQLADAGVVSAPEGMGPRRIIMDEEQMIALLKEGEAGEEPPAEVESPSRTDEDNILSSTSTSTSTESPDDFKLEG